jgi:hypothetical protein
MAVTAPTTNTKNPNCCASAFGRIFYAVDSTVIFSQVLISSKQAGNCYQNNDPTSETIPDLLDTDGGVIPLEDSVGIKALKPFKSGVLIFATNGVWYIYNADGGFKATGFNIAKVSERGITSVRSIVEAEGSVFYFSTNGIMQITGSEFRVLDAKDITAQTIRSYYLTAFAGRNANGIYNEADKQLVWWTPDNTSDGLILDLEVGAFYPQKQVNNLYIAARPFRVNNATLYPFYTVGSTTISYSLAQLNNELFQDFAVDIPAYLVSGFETLGKFANKKSIQQAKVFFKKTETQITGFANGAYVFDKPSSCLFQARWDFDNGNEFKKWVGVTTLAGGSGKAMQLYKPLQRGFIPDAYPYTFSTGEYLLSKKFNIRGNGDAVQFVFEAEPLKDMKMLGYSVNYTMRGRM